LDDSKILSPENERPRSSFAWNAGGWFGSQLGCTLWLLILGLVLLRKDAVAAWVCVAGFVVLNVWGLYLWRSRVRRSAYSGVQRFLVVASVMIAVVVLVVNARGASEPPAGGSLASTYLPYWAMAVAPTLMLIFLLRERFVARDRGGRHPPDSAGGESPKAAFEFEERQRG